MRPVQFILIVLVILVIVLYFSRLRSGLLDRVVVVLFAALGITMAAVPDLTMKMAHAVGVGRGADLFMYLSLVGFGFFGLVLYSKLRDLEASITHLARNVAIQTASRPQDGSADAATAQPSPSNGENA